MGVPPCRGTRPCASTWGRPSFRSRASPRAATALCRCVSIRRSKERHSTTSGGSGQHRAPARPPVLPNAKDKENSKLKNMQSSMKLLRYARNDFYVFCLYQLPLAGAPSGGMNLATIGTRPHPGGGSATKWSEGLRPPNGKDGKGKRHNKWCEAPLPFP
jgi:hypothetical protein